MVLIGFSLGATCQLTKMECHQCDLDAAPSDCLETPYSSISQEDCFNLHTGQQNVTIKYHTDQAKCSHRNCFDVGLKHRENRIVTMMKCVSGTVNM